MSCKGGVGLRILRNPISPFIEWCLYFSGEFSIHLNHSSTSIVHLVYIRLCLAPLNNFDRSNEYIALIGYNYVSYVTESPWAGRHWSARSYEDCSPWTKTTRSTTLHSTSTQGQQGRAQIFKRTVNIPGTTTPTLQTYFPTWSLTWSHKCGYTVITAAAMHADPMY